VVTSVSGDDTLFEVGDVAIFGARDNGEGGNDPADQISFLFEDPLGDVTCEERIQFIEENGGVNFVFEVFLAPITEIDKGNIQVMPD